MLFYRILGAAALALALSLAFGTVYAFLFRDARRGGAAQSPALAGTPAARLDRVFSGIGRIRAATADPQPATVILSVAFPYAPEDRAFSEELASRIADFRRMGAAYFASLPMDAIKNKPEETIKAELLARYNSVLRLGKIETLYFSDYFIIE
jgi:flagellar basal body-associated protein FliL